MSDKYTPENLRSAVDAIRNPFAAATVGQEFLVLDAVEYLADILEERAGK